MLIKNPFRPGAGHMPPYLAGRVEEKREFLRLLDQDVVLQNLVLTGLRGVGKTVLLETFKPLAMERGWLWVGTDLAESTSISERSLAIRLLTDLAVVTSQFGLAVEKPVGLRRRPVQPTAIDFQCLLGIFERTPGLVSDKLKAVVEFAWSILKDSQFRKDLKGVVFAYDESQNLTDHSSKDEYPLSLLLDVFQSLQKRNIPLLLALTGLPTLFPKLVDARTYSERMFRVVQLERLDPDESREAICKPIMDSKCGVELSDKLIEQIILESGGYPYFIQFICREVYDIAIQKVSKSQTLSIVVPEITRKLDQDFFAGRWAKVTDRQRELLSVIATLSSAEGEFTVQEIYEKSREGPGKPFSKSHVGQMLGALSEQGLVYKNRHGKYLFAVPLLGRFILRQSRLI